MKSVQFRKPKLICECGGKTKEIAAEWKGIKVRAWKCEKCREELIHPVDAQHALEIVKARKNKETGCQNKKSR